MKPVHPNFVKYLKQEVKDARPPYREATPFCHPREACKGVVVTIEDYQEYADSEDFDGNQKAVRYFTQRYVLGALLYAREHGKLFDFDTYMSRVYVLSYYAWEGPRPWDDLKDLAEGKYDEMLERGEIPEVFDWAVEGHRRAVKFETQKSLSQVYAEYLKNTLDR